MAEDTTQPDPPTDPAPANRAPAAHVSADTHVGRHTPNAAVTLAARGKRWDALLKAARKTPLRNLKRLRFLRRLRPEDTGYVCLLITGLVITLTAFGGLNFTERVTYDFRTQFCQWGRPAPTDRLVHLDLDDNAITDIGRWPWTRSVQAELLEEIAVAKPKAVALDITYPEAEKPTIVEREDGTYEKIDNDARFEAAVRKLGCVILPYDYETATTSPAMSEIVTRLVTDPGLSQDNLEAELPKAYQETLENRFYDARRLAIYRRVRALVRTGNLSLEQVTREIISSRPRRQPNTPGKGASTLPATETDNVNRSSGPVENLIREAWNFEQSRKAVLPHRISVGGTVLAALDSRDPHLLPITCLAAAAADTAFVTYNKDGDGKMRYVPLVANLDDVGASVSLGLALALRTLDVPMSAVTLTAEKLIIPKDGRAIEIPLRTLKYDALPHATAGNMDLPWFGSHDIDSWQRLYDEANGTKHTVSMAKVWQSITFRKRIARNNEELRKACLALKGKENKAASESSLSDRKYDPYDPAAWTAVANDLIDGSADDFKELQSAPPSPAQEAEYLMYASNLAAKSLVKEQKMLGDQAKMVRRELADTFNNRAILIGWTATGKTDFVPTPLHSGAAGVRIHGVVFNAVMTNKFMTMAPDWLTLTLTAALGLIGTWSIVRLQPLESFFLAFLLVALYLGVSAALFGPYAYVLGISGPLTAIAATYIFGSLVRFLTERAERLRIQRRFSNYVDPQLVNYVLANPDKVGLEGERRHMTVCFTDLEGFTKISERLGEETVGLLNDYFAVMVPLIRKHEGHLNKFLGDGIMFFFNAAPKPKERHAAAAFDAVLDMQAAIPAFNEKLIALKLPAVKMRIGITTGDMVAGDAGGGGASDYTVLGDVVNLSSRLEGANKASGTLILCNRPACEHAGPGYLTRPIGTLKVVGKQQGVETFEVMSTTAAATPAATHIANLTTQMITAYRAAEFGQCSILADTLTSAGDSSKLPKLYRSLCAPYLNGDPVPPDFDGSITLDSK